MQKLGGCGFALENESKQGMAGENNRLAFELLANNFRSRITLLNANLFLQAVFNFVAMRMIYGDNAPQGLPMIGGDVSVEALSMAIPATLVVLWLQFGFHFNGAIETRAAGWDYVSTFLHDDVLSRMLKQLFRDYLILDGWFFLYRSDHNLQFGRWTVLFLMSLMYGGLLAITNANIVIIPILFLFVTEHMLFNTALLILWVVSVSTLIASHYMFHQGNRNTFQWIIFAIGLVFASCVLFYRGLPAYLASMFPPLRPVISFPPL